MGLQSDFQCEWLKHETSDTLDDKEVAAMEAFTSYHMALN